MTYSKQNGYLLITVSLGLVLLGVVALYLLERSSTRVALNDIQHNKRSLDYVLEAGAVHARRLLRQNTSCNNYMDVASTTFGDKSYAATTSAVSGSPIDLTVTARDKSGYMVAKDLSQFPMLQPSSLAILQPGSADGKDTFIEGEDGHQDHNKGDDKDLKTNSETDKEYRSLLRFDLSSIPPRSVVESATFEIYLESTQGQTDTVYINGITRDWKEDEVNWQRPQSGFLSFWLSQGGEYEGQGFGSFVADTVGWKTVDLTELVQIWVSNEGLNDGMILRSPSSNGNNEKKYVSSDDDGQPTLHPRLTVVFSCECGVDCSALIQSGDLAHWKLDDAGGTTAVDTINAHDGTVSGAGWTTGVLDGALEFDGSIDYVAVSATTGLQDVFATGATISMWIRPTDWGELDSGRLLDKTNAGSGNRNGWSLGLRGSSQGLEFVQGFTGSEGHWVTPNNSIELNKWQHVALVYDASSDTNDPQIFINGVEQGLTKPTAPSGTIRSDADLEIRIGNLAGETTRSFEGKIDDVRLIGDMLLSSEIDDLYAEGASLPVAHWKMDETSGITVSDSISNHDGNLIGLPDWTAGSVDGGLRLNTGYHVIVDHDDALSVTDGLTIAAWIKPEASGIVPMRILSKESFLSNNNYWLSLQSGSLWFGVENEFFSPTMSFSTDTWYHVAAVFDGQLGRVSIYVDGTLAYAGGVSATSVTANTDDLYIGRSWDGKFWDGVLDDVRLYDRPLSADEVSSLHTTGGGGGGGALIGDRTYRDEFNQESYSGDDGNTSWSGDWIEINEGNGPTSGDEQVRGDLGHNYSLRVRDNDNGGEGVYRELDLSGCSAATLSYDYRRNGLDVTSDYITIDISADGGSNWTELDRIAGPGTDSSYSNQSHSIDGFLAGNTQIRFLTAPDLGGSDEVRFDNVQVAATCP